MQTPHLIAAMTTTLGLGWATTADAAIYIEEFNPEVANQYTATQIDGGSVFGERTTNTDTGNDSNPSTQFTASEFSGGDYAYISKGYQITTDVIDISTQTLADVIVSIELAESGGFDDSDSVRFELRNAADDTVLTTLDNYTPGGSNQALVAYSGSPYQGSNSSQALGLSPTTLTYNLSDYFTTVTAPDSFRLRYVSDGGTSNTSEDSAVGFIEVVVPEPASLSLLGLGGLLMLGRNRRA
jgi:hypothetical protein